MSWVKIDDNALERPQFLRASRAARLLHLEALAWSSRTGADGLVPKAALPRITDDANPKAAVAALVAAGLWSASKEGWQIEYLMEDQPTADEAIRHREMAAERQARKRRHDAGDHSMCDRCWAVRNGAGVTPNVTRDVTRESQHPVPSRPGTPKRGTKAGRGSASAQGPTGRGGKVTERDLAWLSDMLEGTRCAHCGLAFIDPGDDETTTVGGRLSSLSIHRRVCPGDPMEPQFPEGWEFCDVGGHIMPAGMLQVPADPDEWGDLECMPDFGCGGSDAHIAAEQAREQARGAAEKLERPPKQAGAPRREN